MKQLLYLFASIVLVAGLAQECCAQVPPGYLGKRFAVGYAGSMMNSTSFETARGTTGPGALNYKHNAQILYTVNRMASVGASYSWYSTASDMSTSVREEIEQPFVGTLTCELDPIDNGIITARHIGFFLRQQLGNVPAPVGGYVQFGFERAFWSVAPPTNFALRGDQFCPDLAAAFVNDRHSATVLRLSFGKQVVAFERLMLGYSLETGWLMGGLEEIDPFAPTPREPYNTVNYAETVSRRRLWHHNFVNVQLSAALLLF